MDVNTQWQQKLQAWLQPFLAALGHKSRSKWVPVYVRGLLAPLERKSIQPITHHLVPTDGEQLHHFVATSSWETAPLAGME